MQNLMFLLILIIPIVLIWMYFRKRKNKRADPDVYRKRREGDEVWKTVKKHIKDNQKDETKEALDKLFGSPKFLN